ncbi:MAG: protein kinase [Acidobacteria bacterium]|nr:protein kinase [Acidobacteriota bacterium]
MKKIGKYEIIGELGKGAMGMVYRARDSVLGRLVALKTMLEGVDKDEEMLKRFLIEAQAAAQLNHENIITIYDLGHDDQTYYIAMEFLDGDDLKHIMLTQELSLPEKLNIILQICKGCEYAHNKGVVHRDIKPANVMLLKTGKAKLMDFGIAHMASSDMTKTGMIIGTPDYMSPEQVMGKKIDNRSDIFSVGIILWEMMTHKKPFTSESITTILYKIAHEPLPSFEELNLDVPIEIETVIMKAVEKEQEKRYQSMSEMIKDLEAVIDLYGEKKMATQPALQGEIVKLIEQGKNLMKAKKFQNAAEIYNKALSLDPDNSVLKRLIEKVESELIKTKKGDVEGILKQADKLYKEEKFKEAYKMAESAFDILPDDTSAKIMISRIQTTIADKEKEQLLNDQVKKINTLINKGQYIDALKEVKLLDDIDPKNKYSTELREAINNKRDRADDKKQIDMILNHIKENIRVKNYYEAQKSLSAALSLDSNDPDVLKVKSELDKLTGGAAVPPDSETFVAAGVKTTSEVATLMDKSSKTAEQETVYSGGMESTSVPTVVATPTTGIRKQEIAPDAPTVYTGAAKEYKPEPSATIKAKKPGKSPLPIILGVVAVIAIAIVAVILFTGKGKETEPIGRPLVAGEGLVRINVVPWGTIESVVDSSNKEIEVAGKVSPCELKLPVGQYTITVFNDSLNVRKTFDVSVVEGQVNNLNYNISNMNSETFLKELGIE